MNAYRVISVRVTEAEYLELESAATTDKLKLSTWIKQAAKKAADRQDPAGQGVSIAPTVGKIG